MRLRNLLVVPALLLAGCGTAEPAERAASEPTAMAMATAAANRTVRIEDFEYGPRTITVKPGTRVTWRNRDASNHTVTFAKGPGDLGNVDEGKRLSARFEKAGRYAYVCTYHPSMNGTVVVR